MDIVSSGFKINFSEPEKYLAKKARFLIEDLISKMNETTCGEDDDSFTCEIDFKKGRTFGFHEMDIIHEFLFCIETEGKCRISPIDLGN